MFVMFVFGGDMPDLPPGLTFSDEPDEPEEDDYKCFLQGGKQKCRGCYHEGLCDAQDEYEYERDW